MLRVTPETNEILYTMNNKSSETANNKHIGSRAHNSG